jgi:hypothetical protein
MEKQIEEKFPCKNPDCDLEVKFSGKIVTPGNLSLLERVSSDTLHIDIPAETAELVRGLVLIKQGSHSPDKEQSLPFQLDTKIDSIVIKTFYLTCARGHTNPYNINVEK